MVLLLETLERVGGGEGGGEERNILGGAAVRVINNCFADAENSVHFMLNKVQTWKVALTAAPG